MIIIILSCTKYQKPINHQKENIHFLLDDKILPFFCVLVCVCVCVGGGGGGGGGGGVA